jgi:hypothetical protein
MEDALQRLDKLTQEEARMSIAENLKAAHIVDERVKGVANTVVAIDNRVAGVNDRVASVDDKVAKVIHGARVISVNFEKCLIPTAQTERKQSKLSI